MAPLGGGAVLRARTPLAAIAAAARPTPAGSGHGGACSSDGSAGDGSAGDAYSDEDFDTYEAGDEGAASAAGARRRKAKGAESTASGGKGSMNWRVRFSVLPPRVHSYSVGTDSERRALFYDRNDFDRFVKDAELEMAAAANGSPGEAGNGVGAGNHAQAVAARKLEELTSVLAERAKLGNVGEGPDELSSQMYDFGEPQ